MRCRCVTRWSPKILLADRAYDAEKRVLSRLKAKDCQGFIPHQSRRKVQRTYNKSLYKVRHLIENFWAKLKQYRAIAPRYDKLAINFLGAIHLAAVFLGLKDDTPLSREYSAALLCENAYSIPLPACEGHPRLPPTRLENVYELA